MSRYDTFDKQVAEGTADVALKEKSVIDSARGGAFPAFYRFVVLDVVCDPQAVDDKKVAHWEHTLGVKNVQFAHVLPRNTVIAQRVAEGTASTNETPMFLFPMLPPNVSLPCNPGEQVWAMFDNKSIKKSDIGYWLCRIVGPGFVEDVNHTHMPRMYDQSFLPSTKQLFDGKTQASYEFRPGLVSDDDDGTRRTSYETSVLPSADEAIFEKIMTGSDGGRLRTYEPVPRYRKRPGDVVLEGSNNSLIVLGQNRTGPVATYEQTDEGPVPSYPEQDAVRPGCAAIDIVVGRGQTPETLGKPVENSLGRREVGKSSVELQPLEGDPDLLRDRSRVLITQQSRVDENLGLSDVFNPLNVSDASDGAGSVTVSSDKVRVLARSDVVITVSGYTTDDSGMVASTTPSERAMIVIRSDGHIIVKPSADGVVTVNNEEDSKFVALENLVKTELQKIRDEFNEHLNNSFIPHTHPHMMGPTLPTTQVPKSMGPAGDVAAKKLRTT